MSNIQSISLEPKIFNLKGWINIIDGKQLRQQFDSLLKISEFTVLNYTEQQFPLNGFTALWLLAESHLALHTFTESGWCYIELSSCNKAKAEFFSEQLKKIDASIRIDVEVSEIGLINTLE